MQPLSLSAEMRVNLLQDSRPLRASERDLSSELKLAFSINSWCSCHTELHICILCFIQPSVYCFSFFPSIRLPVLPFFSLIWLSFLLSIYFLSFPPSIDRSIIYPSIYCFSYCPYIHPFVFLSIIHPFIIFNNKILNIKTIFYYTVNCSFLFPFFSHCFFIFIHLMSIYQSIHLFFSFPSIYLFLFFIFNSSELYWHVLHSIVKALTIAWTKNKLLFKKKN